MATNISSVPLPLGGQRDPQDSAPAASSLPPSRSDGYRGLFLVPAREQAESAPVEASDTFLSRGWRRLVSIFAS